MAAVAAAAAAARAKPVSPLAVFANMESTNFVRTWAIVVSACAAGITGVTGGAGFALYAVQHALVVAALLWSMRWRPADYLPGMTTLSFVTTGLADLSNALTFVLFWTVAFALVHIY